MFWVGAAASLCYVPGITGAYIATQWPFLAVVLWCGLLRSGPFTVFHALGLAFIAYACARWFYSPAPYASVFGLWLIIIMGLAVWFGTTMADMRELYAGLALGAAVSSAVGVLQWFGWDAVATATPGHPSGLYVNGVQQGTVLALIAVALASERMWLWILPLVPGIALAQSRGAWIALGVGLLACTRLPRWAVFSAIAAAGLFFLLSPFSRGGDVERMAIWQFATASLAWLGWGPGMFYVIALPRDGAFSFYPEYAHNDALQLLWEYGAAALAPLAIFACALWRTHVKEWPVVLAFVVAGCYSPALFMPLAAFLALAAVGRGLRDYGLARRDRDHSRQYVLPWGQWSAEARGQLVSMAPNLAAKG